MIAQTIGPVIQKEVVSTLDAFKTRLAPDCVLGDVLDYDFIAVNAPVSTADHVSKFTELVGDKITCQGKLEYVKANVDDLSKWLQVSSNPHVIRLEVDGKSEAAINDLKQELCKQLSKNGHFCIPHDDIRVLTSNVVQLHPAELIKAIQAVFDGELTHLRVISHGMKTSVEHWRESMDDYIASLDPRVKVLAPNEYDVSTTIRTDCLVGLSFPAVPADDKDTFRCDNFQLWNVLDKDVSSDPACFLGGNVNIHFNREEKTTLSNKIVKVKLYNKIFHVINGACRSTWKTVTTTAQNNERLALLKKLVTVYKEYKQEIFGLRIEARIETLRLSEAIAIFRKDELADPFSFMKAMELPADSPFRKIVCINGEFFLERIQHVLAQEVPIQSRRTVPVSKEDALKINDLTNMMGVFNKCTKTAPCKDDSWWNPAPVPPPSPLPLALLAGALALVNGEFVDELPVVARRKRDGFTKEQDAVIREAVAASRDAKDNIQWKLKAYPFYMREMPGDAVTMDQMKARFKTLQKQDAGTGDKG